MSWLDVALVTVTIGTALILISPLGRMLGMYAATKLVDKGFVLGMYGRPTWRFWGLFLVLFATHAASHFADGSWILGSAWALMTCVQLAHVANAARRQGDEKPQPDAELLRAVAVVMAWTPAPLEWSATVTPRSRVTACTRTRPSPANTPSTGSIASARLPRCSWGGFEGDVLTLSHGGPGMHARMTSDFSTPGTMRATMEMSSDGAELQVLFEATYHRL